MVVVLVLLVLSSFGVLAQDEISLVRYQMITSPIEDDDCSEDEFFAANSQMHQYCTDLESCKVSVCDGDDNDDEAEFPINGFPPNEPGCFINSIEEDGGFDDDCGWAVAPIGFNINDQPRPLGQGKIGGVIPGSIRQDDPDITCMLDRQEVTYRNGNGVICASNRFWYQCDTNHIGAMIWANDGLYKCSLLNEDDPFFGFVWEFQGADQDKDGYIAEAECLDNPIDDPPNCPQIKGQDEVDLYGLNQQDLREEIRSLCKFPEHAGCAICRNPGSPEVCGDGLNNDCDAQTSDNCDLNQAACTQSPTPEPGKQPTRFCSESVDVECEDDSDCPLGDDEFCKPSSEPGGFSAEAYNIYNTKFSWIETDEEVNGVPAGGYCCGYRGAGDLGITAFEANKEGHFVCLNDNKDLVGRDSDIEGVFPGSPDNPRCKDDWCWVNAVGETQAFKILTIKKPGIPNFDVVSNNDQWLTCDAQSSEFDTLPEPSPNPDYDAGPDDLKEKSNRFYCYQEGDHWSFAECADVQENRKNTGVKGRFAGESLFVLPMRQGDDEEIKEEKVGQTVQIFSKYFKEFYGDGHFLDFTGYTNLNFMVRFIESAEDDPPVPVKEIDNLPVAINLTILGPEDQNGDDIIYYKGNVLGNVINSPFFGSDNYMHVKVPIGGFKAVTSITIESYPAENPIAVKNIYLSKDDAPKLCSGEDKTSESSWLTNIDEGGIDGGITGQKLCSNLYGDTAWLGNDDIVGFQSDANCCGNVQNEYYAGPSQEVVSLSEENQQQSSEAEVNKYGCWNSQAIASGDTIMDVKFEVDYWKKEYSASYESLQVNGVPMVNFRTVGADAEEPYESSDYYQSYIDCKALSTTLEIGDTYEELCQFKISDMAYQIFEEPEGDELASPIFLPLTKGEAEAWFSDVSTDKVEVIFYDLITQQRVGGEILEKEDPDDELYITQESQYIGEGESEDIWNHPIAVVARLKKGEYFPATPSYEEVEETKEITYSCSKDECLFPLPGIPPYKITNPYPHLYELYFVTGSLPEQETLITQPNQEFQGYGNIKAKKVAQQVLYHNKGEDAVSKTGFYACNAAQFIQDNLPNGFTNYFDQPYCSVIGNKFCSYSVEHESGQEKFTTVSSWSDEEITQVGYAPVDYPDEENSSLFYSQIELQLKDKTFAPEKRNHSTSVLPARNFVPNAEFQTSALKIPHWDAIDGSGVPVNGVELMKWVDGGVVTVPSGLKLRSERIAVLASTNLHFSQTQQCIPTITLVDKDGNPTGNTAEITEISTGQASYLLLEFTGPCQIEKPMLQLLDDDGAVEYYYKSQQGTLENFDARSGASCCPENYCWNGYACVEPMTELTSLSEHIEDGRDYRCIDGQWTKSSVKYDWNAQKWGFCKQESECFVLSSEFAEDENTAGSFYDGEYPICIGNSEYIFDHYCDAGSWTSRTKFLATKMMEVAENDDYVLYCSPYRETLLDYENQDSYMGGDLSQVQQAQQDIGQAILGEGEQEVLRTCFTTILDPQGKRLVQDKENTCVNNVCVLRYKEGGGFKTAFATTLNRPVDSPQSFLLSLNVPQNSLGELCVGQEGEFTPCDLSLVNLPSAANLWYSEDLNAVIYAKEGMQINPGVIDTILKWFSGLFGINSKLSEENKFVDEAQNFKDLYILNIDDKGVRAVKEIFPGVKQTLVAEYENFDTPVCEYVYNINLPPELQTELLEEVSGISKLSCTINGTKQRVEMVGGLDFFWPQLTGKLRVS